VIKTLKKKNLREEGFILDYDFRSFTSWSTGFIAFRPEARKNIMAEGHGGKLPTSWWP
jgi:hypothetical protein